MAKMGRPRIEISKEDFEKLCGLQCTRIEIADWFNCSEDTIENWCKRTYKETFSVVFAKKRSKGQISLRRAQFKLAEKNATMAIFLGKQYLGQADRIVTESRSDGMLAELIEGLKDDLHSETESFDETMADEQTEEN
jgi:hypothetical protein